MSELNQDRSNKIRVITVDDHEIVRNGMAFLFSPYDDIEVVGVAHDGEEVMRLCDELKPDVILMNMVMPGTDGVTATHAVRQQYPQVQVLALTSFYDEDLVRQAMQAGAIGYLLKGVPIVELAQAIRAAHAGRPTLAREAMQALVEATQSGPKLGDDLSPRELEVLALLVEGLSNDKIAERLMISPATVKSHVRHIYAKLMVANRAEAAALAITNNLIPTK